MIGAWRKYTQEEKLRRETELFMKQREEEEYNKKIAVAHCDKKRMKIVWKAIKEEAMANKVQKQIAEEHAKMQKQIEEFMKRMKEEQKEPAIEEIEEDTKYQSNANVTTSNTNQEEIKDPNAITEEINEAEAEAVAIFLNERNKALKTGNTQLLVANEKVPDQSQTHVIVPEALISPIKEEDKKNAGGEGGSGAQLLPAIKEEVSRENSLHSSPASSSTSNAGIINSQTKVVPLSSSKADPSAVREPKKPKIPTVHKSVLEMEERAKQRKEKREQLNKIYEEKQKAKEQERIELERKKLEEEKKRKAEIKEKKRKEEVMKKQQEENKKKMEGKVDKANSHYHRSLLRHVFAGFRLNIVSHEHATMLANSSNAKRLEKVICAQLHRMNDIENIQDLDESIETFFPRTSDFL